MTGIDDPLPWLGIAVAAGAGLLIGVERERRKAQSSHKVFAGVRTFTVAALAGALAQSLGQPWMVVAGAALIGVLIATSYLRSSHDHPGITTELALFVTYLIGVAAIEQPVLAAGVSVLVTILLVSRSRLQTFANEVLSADELRDALILAASALIVLPLAPATPIEWLGGVDLRRIWGVVVLLLAIQAAGHIALRALGPRYGLALSGFASGFISSTGTIAALGLRARREPAVLSACVAGALLSCFSTFAQVGLLAAALYPPGLSANLAMIAGGMIASLLIALPWLRRREAAPIEPVHDRRAFSLPKTVGFALLLISVTVVTRWMDDWLGAEAALITVGLAGLADAHAAAASALSLAHGNGIPPGQLALMLLVAITSNSVSKVLASLAGGRDYALRVVPGLLLIAAAAWSGALATGLLAIA